MLVPTQKIKVYWNKANKKYYQALGYEFTKIHDVFYVDVAHCQFRKKTRVMVQCDYCGCEYETNYDSFCRAHKTIAKDACKRCVGHKCAEISYDRRIQKMYARLLETCKSAGYTLLTPMSDLSCNMSRVHYLCPEHGEQEMRAANLLSGKRCPQCHIERSRKLYQCRSTEIVARVRSLGGVVYNPHDYVNQTTKNLLIGCPSCGRVFTTSLRNFTQHGGQACPECSRHGESVGERTIRLWLKQHDIKFEQERWFSDCRDTNPLPFDFYLADRNMIIEYDGRQHFEESDYFNHDLTKIHDQIKTAYCNEHGIKLLRIPYWDFKNIDIILSQHLLLT